MTDEQLEVSFERMMDRLDARFGRDPDMDQARYDALCAHRARWIEAQWERPATLRQPYMEWVERNPEPEAQQA